MKVFTYSLIISCFLASTLGPLPAQAGEIVVPVMPVPGIMVNLSPAFVPAHLQGITIHPDNALQFDFLVHKGDGGLDDGQKRLEYNKLVKYFLASLTIPDENQWVNLSPYEKDRIIENNFGKTEMGRDLLGQDYLLKQITASLMYPESGLGKNFWGQVYQRAQAEYGATDIPVNTFNKVWIVPDTAVVYESGSTAYILKSHLKVMLEEDYLSLDKHTVIGAPDPQQSAMRSVSSQVIREVILPEIEREVNEGKNFAQLRQIYGGMILAAWYKKALKESLLGKVYADKDKVRGVNQDDPKANQEIYQKYLVAFKKGVYNYIKEEIDPVSQEETPRKYFAGGFVNSLDSAMAVVNSRNVDAGMSGIIKNAGEGIAHGILDNVRILLLTAAISGLLPSSVTAAPESQTAVNTLSSIAVEKSDPVNIEKYARHNYYGRGARAYIPMSGKWRDQKINFLIWRLQNFSPEKTLISYGQIFKMGDTVTFTWADPPRQREKRTGEVVAIRQGNDGSIHVFVYEGDGHLGIHEFIIFNVVSGLTPNVQGSTNSWVVPKQVNAAMLSVSKEKGFVGMARRLPTQDTTTATSANPAQTSDPLGGIDMNSANLNLRIKRDGRGVPLPLAQQDMAQLGRIEGFVPRIIEIKTLTTLPILSELLEKFQNPQPSLASAL